MIIYPSEHPRYSIKLIKGPTAEPVTVDQVKMQTHIDNDVEDDLLALWIQSGREQAEDYLRRACMTQIVELSFDGFPSAPFNLLRGPVQQVMTIKYTDSQGVTYTVYDSGDDPGNTTTTHVPFAGNNKFIIADNDPCRITLAYGTYWPNVILQEIDALKVRYAIGFGEDPALVPAYIKNSILLYCAYCNENRSGEIPEMPAHILNLLRPRRGNRLVWESEQEGLAKNHYLFNRIIL